MIVPRRQTFQNNSTGPETTMIDPWLDAIRREFSPDRAKALLERIHETDRFFSFDRFAQTAEVVAQAMREAGLDDIEQIPVPADGRTRFGDWIVPTAWDATEASLRLVGPADFAVELARYPETPENLFQYSAPTPEEGITAELVVMEDSPSAEAIRGRFILTSQPPEQVVGLAEQHGAVGLVSDFLDEYPNVRTRQTEPDAVRWTQRCFVPQNRKDLFGFSLTPRQGAYLRWAAKQAGENGARLRLRVEVRTRLYPGRFVTVTGVLRGRERPKEEILALGHLYEPGANDNASGPAVGIEAVRAVAALVKAGRLPGPKRSIRLFWSFESSGVLAYAATHRKQISRTLAGLNLDMVGADPTRCSCRYHLHRNPHAMLGVSDALLTDLFRRTMEPSRFAWSIEQFDLADNLIADPSIGVPTPAIWQYPERAYHSSLDLPENISLDALRAAGTCAGTYLYALAAAGDAEIPWLIELTGREAAASFVAEMQDIVVHAPEQAEALPDYLAPIHGRLDYYQFLGRRMLESCGAFVGRDRKGFRASCQKAQAELSRSIHARWEQLERQLCTRTGLASLPEPSGDISPEEEEASRLVIKRQVFGPVTLDPIRESDDAARRWYPAWSSELNARLFWADGKRTAREIGHLLRHEFGAVDWPDLLAFYELLKKHRYIKIRTK